MIRHIAGVIVAFSASYSITAIGDRVLLRVPQAVGFYSNGTLVNPDTFADEGTGFVKIFRGRDRRYAAAELTEVIAEAGESLVSQYPDSERLQLGDSSQFAGGRISGHSSHQNGLDIDISLPRKDHREMGVDTDSGFDESFVNGTRVTANLDVERTWHVVQSLVSTGLVRRVFIDAVIKGALCQYALRSGVPDALAVESLRRLRPWPNHDDHMHIRIGCPDGSTQCVPQDEPPEGSGCQAVGPKRRIRVRPSDPGEF